VEPLRIFKHLATESARQESNFGCLLFIAIFDIDMPVDEDMARHLSNIRTPNYNSERILITAIIRGVSKKFGEWYQKTNKTELTLLAFKIIAILHNTLLAMFIKLLETVSKCLFRNRSQNRCHTFFDCRRPPLIWRLQTPDQGSTVGGLLCFTV
jgi:hypothetical protein